MPAEVNRRPLLVVVTATYEPGFKGGGPIRSLVNLVDAVSPLFRIGVVTRDRDVGESEPYEGIDSGAWIRRGRSAAFYCSTGMSVVRALVSALRHNERSTILYLNSFFEPRFSILPVLLVWLRILTPRVVVLAPRGEFSAGALVIHSFRKRLYLFVARTMRLHDRVYWHATSATEAADIRRVIGSRAEILNAPNISNLSPRIDMVGQGKARREPLVVTFFSRVSRKKNLAFAIRALKLVSVPIEFRIAGPIEDGEYWAACQEELRALPRNVRVVVVGAVQPRDVGRELARAHLFFLPTLGENYGHVIAESLMAGVPVLISDQTPWRDLERIGIGWDFHLGDPGTFARAIERCATLSDRDYLSMRSAARRFAEEVLGSDVSEESAKMFGACLAAAEHGVKPSLRGPREQRQ